MNMYFVNTKVGKKETKISNYYSRLFNVNSKLGEFSRNTRRDKKLSADDVERISRQGGKKGISAAYVLKIENNPDVNPTVPLQKALAEGLGVSEEQIFALARGENPDIQKIGNEQLVNIGLTFNGLVGTNEQERGQALIDLMEREMQLLAKKKQN